MVVFIAGVVRTGTSLGSKIGEELEQRYASSSFLERRLSSSLIVADSEPPHNVEGA